MVVMKIGTKLRIVVQAEFPEGHEMAGTKYADADTLEEAQAVAVAALAMGAAVAGIAAHYRRIEEPKDKQSNVTDFASFQAQRRH